MSHKKLHEPMHIEVDTFEEFEDWVSEKFDSDHKLKISKVIVNSILDNLDQDLIHVFEILVKEQNSVYDITVHEEDFIFTLEKNLKILERFEEFEMCSKVIKTINKLKNA